ncbi:MAG: FAD-dependent oxidoreductase, partial [Gammaproteobacteria bacterium]
GGTGLGVHATIDLGGQVKFGPDIEYVDNEDYSVSTARLAAGLASIRRYFPSLDQTQLTPGYAGIRPKLQAPGEPPRDFEIQGSECH